MPFTEYILIARATNHLPRCRAKCFYDYEDGTVSDICTPCLQQGFYIG